MEGLGRRQVAVAACALVLGLLPADTLVPVPAAFSAPPVDRGPLTQELPGPLPAPGTRAAWLTIDGLVEHSSTVVRYRLFVNPRFDGLYQITQYRMWKAAGPGAESEKVLWNEEPGSGRPLRIFELVDGRWQVIAAGTPAYTREITHAIRVYDLHRQARGHGAGFTR